MCRFHRIFVALVVVRLIHCTRAQLIRETPLYDDIATTSPGEGLTTFLGHVLKEQNYPSVVVLAEPPDLCVNVKPLMSNFTVLLLRSSQNYPLKEKFNRNFLTLVCFREAHNQALLEALSRNLAFLRTNKVILVLESSAQTKTAIDLEEIFQFCAHQQFLNVVAIADNFSASVADTIYTYTKFPKFRITPRHYSKRMVIFPDRLDDLQGHSIRTILDEVKPRSFLYIDAKGVQQMGGYVTHFMKLFAKRHNAKLVYGTPDKLGGAASITDFLEFIRNGSIDIPTSIVGEALLGESELLSYPLVVTDWCVMLPVEKAYPVTVIYLYLIGFLCLIALFMQLLFSVLLGLVLRRLRHRANTRFSKLDIVFNEKAFRGVLGLSFSLGIKKLNFFLKFTLILMFLTGLITNTIYGVYLETYTTNPPLQAPVRTFGDLQRSTTKLMTIPEDYRDIYELEGMQQFSSMFNITDSITDFLEMREAMNTSYAYPILSSDWPIWNARQELISRKLFRFSSEEMCFRKSIHMRFLLPANSIYGDILDRAIMQVHESGLLQYWMRMAFNELGHIPQAEMGIPREHTAMSFEEFQSIGLVLALGLLCGTLVFILELAIDKMQRRHV